MAGIVTGDELAARASGQPSLVRYSMGTGGEGLHHHPNPRAMTAIALENLRSDDALLIAPSRKHLIQFRNVGSNQAWTAQYQLIDGKWIMRSSGFNWIGILHDRYRSFKAKGYRKP